MAIKYPVPGSRWVRDEQELLCGKCRKRLVSAQSRQRGLCADCDPTTRRNHAHLSRPRAAAKERSGGATSAKIPPAAARAFWLHNVWPDLHRPCRNRFVAPNSECGTCGRFRLVEAIPSVGQSGFQPRYTDAEDAVNGADYGGGPPAEHDLNGTLDPVAQARERPAVRG